MSVGIVFIFISPFISHKRKIPWKLIIQLTRQKNNNDRAGKKIKPKKTKKKNSKTLGCVHCHSRTLLICYFLWRHIERIHLHTHTMQYAYMHRNLRFAYVRSCALPSAPIKCTRARACEMNWLCWFLAFLRCTNQNPEYSEYNTMDIVTAQVHYRSMYFISISGFNAFIFWS